MVMAEKADIEQQLEGEIENLRRFISVLEAQVQHKPDDQELKFTLSVYKAVAESFEHWKYSGQLKLGSLSDSIVGLLGLEYNKYSHSLGLQKRDVKQKN